jgi:hypothetical protein
VTQSMALPPVFNRVHQMPDAQITDQLSPRHTVRQGIIV